MKELSFEKMESIEGGEINCEGASRVGTVFTILSLGLFVAAEVSTGPVGVAMSLMSGIFGVESAIASAVVGIKCW